MHRSAEIEDPNENDDQELQGDELQGVPDWLWDFKHGLVDESVPEHRDTASSSEPYFRVIIVSTHFPKDPNCDTCLKTRISRSSRRRPAGTVMTRAETFW